MNNFMNGMKQATNFDYTANGGLQHNHLINAVYEMYAKCGAYRQRSDEDCIFAFKQAFDEDEEFAMKCLFYLRDILEGAGERRFFRVCYHWLATKYPDAARRNLKYIPEFGRWDDIFSLVGTPLEKDAFALAKHQLAMDAKDVMTPNGAISLCAKWMPSINASSQKTRTLGNKLRKYMGFSERQYRKLLSTLRERINVLERLMSANEWDKIDFSAIPSQAGIKYRKAFIRHDLERKKADPKAVTYEEFVKDDSTKVNAGAMAPYEVVHKAVDYLRKGYDYSYDYRTGRYIWHTQKSLDDTERLAINKYWDNLADYFKDATFNGICVVDTSGSMTSGCGAATPIDVAISLGLYCAERNHGPFANHYISFASRPQMIETSGIDFVDKVLRIYQTNLVDNTNLEAVFNLMLQTAINNNCSQDDIPKTVLVISDMQVDQAVTFGYSNSWDYNWGDYGNKSGKIRTMMEKMRERWSNRGYQMPKIVYWNVNASQDTFLDDGPDVTYVSGASATIFKQILTGKTGMDLMMDTLSGERYKDIH